MARIIRGFKEERIHSCNSYIRAIRVPRMYFWSKDYQARVTILIENGVVLQEDAIASIKTKGLIGDKYLQITPRGSEKIIPDGGTLRGTEKVACI